MPSPFPGMDPYLEHYELWPSVHAFLIAQIAAHLGPRLRPRYYVSIEERFYVLEPDEARFVGIADVLVGPRSSTPGPSNGHSVEHANGRDGGTRHQGPQTAIRTVELPGVSEERQRFVEIHEVGTRSVVTVIEVLSPVNKLSGSGRNQYEAKRLAIANSYTNLVEIDLLRNGPPLPLYEAGEPIRRESLSDYRLLVSRGADRSHSQLYTFSVRDQIPSVPIPLRAGDEEPQLDLKVVIDAVYDLGSYEVRTGYHADPVPPLKPEDASWADALLREKGLR